MPKINLAAVPKYSPRPRVTSREYGARNVRQSRAQRAMECAPDAFTLYGRLQLEMADGSLRQSSQKQSVFSYSFDRMRWENEDALQWNCTINCEVVALDLYHPILLGKPVLRQLTSLNLEPGMTITFEPGNVHISEEVFRYDLRIPPEDYVIDEEPEAIDWQKQLVKELGKPKKKRFIRR